MALINDQIVADASEAAARIQRAGGELRLAVLRQRAPRRTVGRLILACALGMAVVQLIDSTWARLQLEDAAFSLGSRASIRAQHLP